MVILILMVMLFQINSKIAIGDKVVYNDKFKVLIGQITLEASDGTTPKKTGTMINFPAGFNAENCVVIGAMTGNVNVNWGTGWNYESSSNSGDLFDKIFPISVSLYGNNMSENLRNKIRINVVSRMTSAQTINYKIILMKTEPDVANYQPGDVDMNGEITANDYELVKDYIMSQVALTGEQFKLADINNDGDVKANDYQMIKNIVDGNS